MKQLLLKGLIVILCIHMSIGCAAIVHGTSQDIHISSSPDDAEVWVDGARVGRTPTIVNLSRKHDYLVKIVKDGYKESTVKIEGNTSAWILGNVIFGGLIGCGIDFISGGAYDLTPERLDVNLTQITALNGKSISIPDDTFEKVKEIRFIGENGKPEIILSIK